MYLEQLSQQLNPGFTDYQSQNQQKIQDMNALGKNGIQNGMQVRNKIEGQLAQAHSNGMANMQQQEQEEQKAKQQMMQLGMMFATGGAEASGDALSSAPLLKGIGQESVQQAAANSLMPNLDFANQGILTFNPNDYHLLGNQTRFF